MSANHQGRKLLADGALILLFVPVALFVLLIAGISLEVAFRWVGGMYQLGGLGAVAAGLANLQGKFNLPSVSSRLANEAREAFEPLRRLLPGRWGTRRRVVMKAGSGTISLPALAAVLTVGQKALSPEATIQEKTAWLVREAERLNTELKLTNQRLSEEASQYRAGLDEERQNRREDIEELRDRVADLAIGGIHTEQLGFLFLLLGVVLATWAPELAAIFGAR
jgi:hypothetical protein